MKLYKIFKILSINLIILICLLIPAEIILGNKIYSNKLNCNYLLCSANHFYKNTLYKGKDIINYKKDKYGFRGLRKNIYEIDILTVGGSTTDERYLEEKDTWSEKLEDKINNYFDLDIDVVNAGIDGQSTIGHIWNFTNWFNRLDNFKPKYIFFYIGLNENFHNINNNSKNDKNKILKKIKVWLKENDGIIYKSYYLIYRHYYLKDVLNVGHKIRQKNYNIISKSFDFNKDSIRAFNLRLDKLVELSKNINAIPVFITQKTLRHKIINNEIYSIDTINYYQKEKIISKIIMNNCKKNNIFCIDIFEKIKFKDDSLYDLVHSSPSGAELISKIIFDESKSKIKF